MKNSVREELAQHILDLIDDEVISDGNKDEWHFHAFNEDYYIIGYYDCGQWLKRHEVGEFEAAGICQEYEKEMFGECHNVYDNSEKVVNMLAYIWGEELLSEIDARDTAELREELEELV